LIERDQSSEDQIKCGVLHLILRRRTTRSEGG
jgi:hypothetical protein